MAIGPPEGVLLGANLGRAIVTNGDFTGSVCDMPAPSELRFGVMLAVGRGTAVLDAGQRSPTIRERFGGFVLHFHNGECHWIADDEMFPIHMRKLDNISVRQTYPWIPRFVRFLVMYSVSTSTSGFMRNSQNRNAYSVNSTASSYLAARAAITAVAAAATCIPYFL